MAPVKIAFLGLDDNEDDLLLVRREIDQSPIEDYQLFTDEFDFIEALTDEVHICIVDHRLPHKSGLEILKIIKAKNRFSYVIGYSAMKDPDVLISYIKNKVDDWVDKNDWKNRRELLREALHTAFEIGLDRLEAYRFFKNAKAQIDRE